MLRPFNFLCRVLIKGVLVRILYIECTTEVRREMTSLLCSKTRPPKRVSTSARDLYSRVASVYLPLGEYQFTAGILPIRQSPTTTQIPIPIRLSSATRSVLLILNIGPWLPPGDRPTQPITIINNQRSCWLYADSHHQKNKTSAPSACCRAASTTTDPRK